MEEHYPIMDKSYKELILEEIEDESLSFVNAAAKTFYKAKGELVAFSIGNYMDSRFTKRIERFAKEENLLSPHQIKEFYESIDETNLDLLFELLDKTRTTTYDLHAKILSKIYRNFLSNKKLTYFETTLLSYINMLNEQDVSIFYVFINSIRHMDKEERIPFKIANYEEMNTFQKCIQLGVVKQIDAAPLDFTNAPILSNKTVHLTDFTYEFLNILDAIKFTTKSY